MLAFYTWWTQRKTDTYIDPDLAVFSFYLPPGAQSAMWEDFECSDPDKLGAKPQEKVRWIKYIWRVIHPPSYFLAIECRGTEMERDPSEIDKFYARHARLFSDVPMTFNIFSKRVIAFIAGNNVH